MDTAEDLASGPVPSAPSAPSAPSVRLSPSPPPSSSPSGGTASGGTGGAGLSERDLAVLAVERRGWPGPGAKERAIREQLGMSPTRYYQLLNALLDDPRALEHDAVTVNRLRRVRAARRARR